MNWQNEYEDYREHTFGVGNPTEPDIDAIDEALWEQYLEWCEENSVSPDLSDYERWLDENFE